MEPSNFELCYRGIQRVYRNVIVRHIRERLKSAFGDEAEEKLKVPFKVEWDKIKQNALKARSDGHVDTPLLDDFDVLSVNHFYSLFEKYGAHLLPAGTGKTPATMLSWMREIKDLRDPMSHPSEADLSYEDAFRALDNARRVVRLLGYRAEEKDLRSIAEELARTPHSADSQRAGQAQPVDGQGPPDVAEVPRPASKGFPSFSRPMLASTALLLVASLAAVLATRAHEKGDAGTSASVQLGSLAESAPSAAPVIDAPAVRRGHPPCFRPVTHVDIDGSLDSITPGDLNGDQRTDLVLLSRATNVAKVLLAREDGTFQAAGEYNTHGTTPRAATVADFNGDDLADLAIANWSTRNVLLMLGTGAGTFRMPITHSAGGSAVAMTDGDFNGDGDRDLALLTAAVGVLLGNGRGAFLVPAYVAAGANPDSLATGDFNEDHRLDLAVANTGSNDVSVLLGRGNGAFRDAVSYGAGPTPVSIIAADVTGDGHLDVAVAGNAGSNSVEVLAGNGDGTFKSAVAYSAGTTPASLAAADFNGDHKIDVAVANRGSLNVSLLLQGDDGVLQPAVTFELGRPATDIVVGDFNGDGKPDIATLNSTAVKNLSVLLNCP